MLGKILEVSILNTVVDGTEDIAGLSSHLSVLRVRSHGVSNSSSNLSSGSHDRAESSLEVAPEVEVLELHLLVKRD